MTISISTRTRMGSTMPTRYEKWSAHVSPAVVQSSSSALLLLAEATFFTPEASAMPSAILACGGSLVVSSSEWQSRAYARLATNRFAPVCLPLLRGACNAPLVWVW